MTSARLFEFLLLEGAQAGLSWITILKKRENYRRAFDDFDVKKSPATASKMSPVCWATQALCAIG
jgi:3-methyladenine DNA glycosylase Tag